MVIVPTASQICVFSVVQRHSGLDVERETVFSSFSTIFRRVLGTVRTTLMAARIASCCHLGTSTLLIIVRIREFTAPFCSPMRSGTFITEAGRYGVFKSALMVATSFCKKCTCAKSRSMRAVCRRRSTVPKHGYAPASARRRLPARRLELWELWGIMGNYGELCGIMGNYGELWGIWVEFGWNYGKLWGIMGELWGIMGELWGIMGNYGGIMGNYGGIMGNYGVLWGIMGELWVIMGNLGELWGNCGLVLILDVSLFVPDGLLLMLPDRFLLIPDVLTSCW